MDPLSIAASCAGIITFVANPSTTISAFVRTVRDARHDLAITSGQLTQLKLVLEMLADDHLDPDDPTGTSGETTPNPCATSVIGNIPDAIKTQILSILSNCHAILNSIDALLGSYEAGPLRSAKWAVKGKAEVAGFNKLLDAHLQALNLALEVSALAVLRDVKDDTMKIKDDTMKIKDDTMQIKDDTELILKRTDVLAAGNDRILDEIARLQSLVADSALADHAAPKYGIVMQRYIESVTEYSESVMGDPPTEVPSDDEQNSDADTDGLTPGNLMADPVADRSDPKTESQLEGLSRLTCGRGRSHLLSSLGAYSTSISARGMGPISSMEDGDQTWVRSWQQH